MTKLFSKRAASLAAAGLLVGMGTAMADDDGGACNGMPSQEQLRSALVSAVVAESSGLNLNMWATIVDRDGNVCAVAFSGNDRRAQWTGSRAISAQKANTANLFNLDPGSASNSSGAAGGLALSGLVDREPVLGDAAWRQPVRPAGKQPRERRRCLQGTGGALGNRK